MVDHPEPIRALSLIVDALEQVGAPYALGGSVASSYFGEPRTTMDIDLLVELDAGGLNELLAVLGDEVYVPEEAARLALRRRASFNVLHHDTGHEIDVFVSGAGLLDQEQLRRRREVLISDQPELRAWMTAPENIVLRKLDWHRRAGGSDRQWRDVLGVLKEQGGRLDLDYLQRVGRESGLEASLGEALEQAGLGDA
ncbi:MAG: hypothetical protein AAF533_26535 [Acidobacteriota bacterium]